MDVQRLIIEDEMKSASEIQRQIRLGLTCSVEGCNNPLTHMTGPGSKKLCREHQIEQREYGGMGRTDRPHTFHRKWQCSDCGYQPLEDPRLADITDEMQKRRVARILMHGDHNTTRKADGGDDSADNIRSQCVVCHAKKTVLNKDYLVRKSESP